MGQYAGLYIGLMSGTSLDGIDAALVAIEDDQVSLQATYHHPYPTPLRERLRHLCHAPQLEVASLMQADIHLARLMTTAVEALLAKSQTAPHSVIAIGSHGQTIRHLPEGDYANTLQIGDPNTLAQGTGITTIADFRRRDMAAGGQGAPLVPAFHQALFRSDRSAVAVNIGGISNITILPPRDHGTVNGFDTGPGNCLMDYWIERHRQQAYDRGGEWAASGTVLTDLLSTMQDDAYFHRPPPKSSGREYFNPDWLAHYLGGRDDRPEDVQATLCQLTAWCIADAIANFAPDCEKLFLCGGGSHNRTLVHMLAEAMPEILIVESSEAGIAPDWIEATAFAWLAYRHLAGLPGNLPEVTGATQTVVLGGHYPVG